VAAVYGSGRARATVVRLLLLTETVTIIDVKSLLVPAPRWRRPYRDPFKIIPATIATIGTLFLAAIAIATTVTMAQGTSHVPAFALPAVVVFGLVWLTFAWRMYRTALLVSDTGVRVRWPLLTRTFHGRRSRVSTRHPTV
jgi:hypothetical protein